MQYTIYKPVYKTYSKELENVAFTISCPLYTNLNNMHCSWMPFIDSDLLYGCAL